MRNYQFNVLSLLVENEFGVLTRITALIRRRGYNISALAVAETMDPAFSRITLTLQCEPKSLPQIVEQLRKLVCVVYVEICQDDGFMSRELVMVRVRATNQLHEVAEIADQFQARLIEGNCETLTLELSDIPQKTHALIDALAPLGIESIARTGIVALERSEMPTGE